MSATKGGQVVEEDPTIIQMNIANFTALLKLYIDDEKRAAVTRLLLAARNDLARATASETPGLPACRAKIRP